MSGGSSAHEARFRGLSCAFLIGPTAAGKSPLALAVAELAGAEIVSLDSMQVYRGMDVGTAKPSSADRARVRHHMLDLVEPSERYDVRRYLADLAPVLDDLRARGARALLVGGTGFYLKALLSGIFEGPPADLELRARIERRVREIGGGRAHAELERADPRSAARIHENDTKRLVRALEVLEQTGRPLSDWQREWGWHGSGEEENAASPAAIVGLDPGAAEVDRRIELRTRAMLEAGWPAEAARIRSTTGFGPTSSQALGYREALALHDGEMDSEACAEAISRRTRRFARRQRTWYRSFAGVRWLEAGASPGDAVRALGFGAGDPADRGA
jgi:tRNA dimethylallyltransferase